MAMCDYCRRTGDCGVPEWHSRAVTNGDMYCSFFKPFKISTISMAYTSGAFCANAKTVTRRSWQPVTIRRFTKDTKFLAVRSNYGGEALGVGKITENPYKQNTKDMSDEEYQNEGFDYLDTMFAELSDGHLLPLFSALQDWRNKQDILSVVPFEVIEVFPGMLKKYTQDDEIRRCVKALVKAIG